MTINGIKTRKPTGRVPWPCILLEGEPKAGKSYAAAQLSASDKVGATYWIDLDEGAADEYGVLPGARYEVIEHDGSYAQVLAAVKAVKAEAERARDAGEPPVVLVIDTLSAVWDKLKDWASDRAKKSNRNRELLKRDPNAEVTISQNLWNDAGARWGALTTPLLTFPGIVVLIARGKEVTDVDDNGRPIEGKKVWRVEVRRGFEHSPSVWMRMRREEGATLVGARSLTAGTVPGVDRAKSIPEQHARTHLLEWLIFDALKVDPGTAQVRDLKEFHGGELLPEEQVAPDPEQPAQARRRPFAVADAVKRIDAAADDDELRAVWADINRAGQLQTDVETEGGSFTLAELITARHERFADPGEGATGVVAKARAQGKGAPATGREAAAEAEAAAAAPTRSATPDPEQDCRNSSARRGVVASLQSLGVTDEAIAERFGRPIEQVATKRLTGFVREVIAETRAKVDA